MRACNCISNRRFKYSGALKAIGSSDIFVYTLCNHLQFSSGTDTNITGIDPVNSSLRSASPINCNN